MTTNKNNTTLEKSFERIYDETPIFKQGIAIVRSYGKFGAIMVGGKEIVPPIYDGLSEFKDGYAIAKWNDEERVVNLSGQICVSKDDKKIFLPEEYDWGYDFVENVCVVVKNDKYGIIDHDFNVKQECEYDSFSNYHEGYAIFRKYRWSEWSDDVWSDEFLINNVGEVNLQIEKLFLDGHKIVRNVDSQQKLYGVMNSNMQIIIPIEYTQIKRLKNSLYIADSNDETKLFLDSRDGKIISEIVVDGIIDISEYFFCTYKENKIQNKYETYIYKSPESLQLCIPSKLHVESDENGNVIFEYRDLKYKYDVNGNLYIVAKKTYYGYESWMYRWDNIIERKVRYNYLDYNHKPFSKKYEIIEDNQNKKGLSDFEGNVIFAPQYMEIHSFTNEMFIVSLLLDGSTTPKFGVVDVCNNVKVPFIFNYLIPINDEYLAYTDNELNLRDKLSLPSSFMYTNIRFGITDARGKIITKSIFNQIILNVDKSAFIVREEGGVGVINNQGQYILNPKYNSITYNEQAGIFTTAIQYSKLGNYPFETRTNDVSFDGCYIVKNHIEEIVRVPAQIVDWCDDFAENEIASVIKNGYSGHINNFNQFVSFMNDKKIIMPSEYDFIRDFIYDNAPVLLNGKWGIVDSNLKLVIPCNFEYIEPISNTLFKFKKGDKWGLVGLSGNLIANAEYISILHETDNLLKVESHVQNGSSTKSCYGFLDCEGNILVPAECKTISRIELGNDIFFIAEKDYEKGIIDQNGNIIVPLIYNYISDGVGGYFYCSNGKINSFYKFNGEHYIYINDDYAQAITIPSDYDYAAYIGYGLIKVSKADDWGLMEMSGEIIAEPQYASIETFDDGFAKVGITLKESSQSDESWIEEKLIYGLIDTTGEIVLPIEYEEIEKWDNGYYVICQNGLYGLLSPLLHIVIEPCKNHLKKLNDEFILEVAPRCTNSLIDYFGNKIDLRYGDFVDIEVLENGFLKVIFYRTQCREEAFIGIFNSIGKNMYCNSRCEDITYIKDGLLLVKGSFGVGYNIVTLQGKELFNTHFDSIEILENGDFIIRKNDCYGMAKNTGNILVHPKYENKINFENGFAKIKIRGSSFEHKIGIDGHVVLLDSDQKEIRIPKEYYWGTDFINGVSIVRTITNDYCFSDCVGVIDEEGNTLIPAEYNQISLFSDNTLLVKQDDFYGLYDICGNCILPTVFTLIEHISKDRIRVVWNLGIVKSWTPGIDTGKDRICNYSGDGPEWIVKNRSALCDARGNIITDKTLVYVGKFINGYARSYREVIINDKTYNVKFKKVGVVDINGNTILENDYDEVVLCNQSFAPIRIEGKIGIVDINNKKIRFFEEINRKNVLKIDSYGRIVFVDKTKQYPTHCGVINFNGVIVPSGKYSHIELLDNGLIKVSNKECTMYGILGSNGEEILKTEYSYISEFNNGFASICIGGTTECIDENFLGTYKHIGGKWGVIDDAGAMVVECIHDEEQILPKKEENTLVDSIKASENNAPTILCTDYISYSTCEEIDNNYYDDIYNDDDYDDDDTSSIYNNPYYNDNLDMDQQSIEFWNNI